MKHVLIGAGVYSEVVQLWNGIGLYGGYAGTESENWARSTSFVATIRGSVDLNSNSPSYQHAFAVRGTSISSATMLNRLTVESPNAAGNGKSSYGVHCSSCAGLRVDALTVVAGNGSVGSAGGSGSTGSDGGSGSRGGNGDQDERSSNLGKPGSGASSTCGAAGGRGGTGGVGSSSGTDGSSGSTISVTWWGTGAPTLTDNIYAQGDPGAAGSPGGTVGRTSNTY